MKTIRIAYSNLWGHSEAFHANYLLDCFPMLRGHYQFELSETPDVALYSVYGYVTKRYETAIRVVYAGEPGDHFAIGAKIDPVTNERGFYHYGITCAADNTHERHAYMPQGFLHLNLYNNGVQSLIQDGSPPPAKEFFADFTYSNGNSRDRIDFFQKLSGYKRVESCGAVLRNNDALRSASYSKAGYLLKQAFQARCKFSIAMENNYFISYISEKLTDPFVARSVPIYQGSPTVGKYFNPYAFVNISDFDSDETAIERIKFIDTHDDLYQSMLNEPPFVANRIPDQFTDERYLAFWKGIFGQI